MLCTVKIKYLLLTQGLRGYSAAHLLLFGEKSVGFYPPTFCETMRHITCSRCGDLNNESTMRVLLEPSSGLAGVYCRSCQVACKALGMVPVMPPVAGAGTVQ